jgi:hypothetical protein
MECEVVYFVVPRAGVAETFAELAARHDPARVHLAATEHSMALEGQAVGDLKPVRTGCPDHADHGDSVGCFVSSHATTTSRSSRAKAASSLASLALTCPGASYSAVFRLARQVSR